MDVEPLRLGSGETVGDGEELLAHRPEVLEPLFQLKVREVIGAELVAQEHGELLVLPEEGMLAIDPEDMMSLRHLLEDGVQLPLVPPGQAQAEELGDLVGGQLSEAELAGPREERVNREAALEDEVAAVFDLLEEIVAAQEHRLALAPGELGPEHQRPVVKALANNLGAKTIGGRLKRGRVRDGQERIVVLTEPDPARVSSWAMKEWPLR